MTVRTRFAPSPTGRLHLGNIRIAVFNWLFTRHHGGSFVLRVEDTDVDRNVEGAEDLLMEDLRWLGLEWDEGPDVGGPYGPYRQSERGAAYTRWLDTLVESGAAYPCFAEEVDEEGGDRRYPGTYRDLDPSEARARVEAGELHVLRLRSPQSGVVEIVDEVRGNIAFPADDIDDFVLRRRDGRPTYNFAVVADDVDMAITHVIRGGGHLSNTPKQALIFDAMGQARPHFVHLPNVLAPDGGKLSKRRGALGVGEFRDLGMLPEALVNYLSLLGWSHPEEKEILTREELVATVDLDRVRASEMAYDPEKLRWVGSQHMSTMDADAVAEGVRPFVDGERYPHALESLPGIVAVLQSRMSTFGEIQEHLEHFYPSDPSAWAEARDEIGKDASAQDVLVATRESLASLDSVEPSTVRDAIRGVGKATGAKGPALYHPIRKALSGMESGPDLGGIAATIGREETLRRLDAAIV